MISFHGRGNFKQSQDNSGGKGGAAIATGQCFELYGKVGRGSGKEGSCGNKYVRVTIAAPAEMARRLLVGIRRR